MNIANLAISITAVDATSNIFRNINKSISKTTKEMKELWDAGRKVDSVFRGLKAAGSAAAWGFTGLAAASGAHQIVNSLADAQEGFNKIRVLSGKTEDQMRSFREEIYKIAAETSQGPEKILTAAIDKIGEGMNDADIFATLRAEGLYTTASFSKNMEGISSGALAMRRAMSMGLEETNAAMFAAQGLRHAILPQCGFVVHFPRNVHVAAGYENGKCACIVAQAPHLWHLGC